MVDVRALVVVVAGCGRLGFSDGAPDAAARAPDADTDAAVARAALCNATQVFDLSSQLGSGDQVIAVRAASFAGGYLLAMGTAELNIYALHLDANLVPTEVSAHLPLPGNYTLWSAGASTAFAYVFVGDTDGYGYLKQLDNDFNNYTAVQQVGRFPADPALVSFGNGYLLGAVATGGDLGMFSVDADGSATSVSVSYAPAANAVSLAATAAGAEAAISGSDCEVFAVDSTGATSAHQTFASSCTDPNLAPDASAVVYAAGGTIFRYDLPTATTTTVAAGHAPRTLAMAGATWTAYLAGDGSLALASTSAGASLPTQQPAQSLDLIAVGSDVVPIWLAGNAVWQGRACVQ